MQIWAQTQGHYVAVNPHWVQVWGFTYITARMSSILTLSVISLERMLAVMTPYFYRSVDRSHAVLLVSICWLLSVLVGISPYLVGQDYEYFKGAAMASNNRELAQNVTYYVITEVLSLYLPTLAILVSVSLISWRVGRMKRRAHKVTATLVTVLVAYIACFSVYFIFMTLSLSHLLYLLPLSAQLYIQNFAFLSLVGHSAVNPIIYALKAAQFREEIKQIENRAIVRCLNVLLKFRKQQRESTVQISAKTDQIPTVAGGLQLELEGVRSGIPSTV